VNKVIAGVAAALYVGGIAHAQTSVGVPDIFNQTIYTGTGYLTQFSVSGNDGNVLMEGSATAASGVTGIVIVAPLSSGGSFVEDLNFAAGNTSGNYFDIQHQNLVAGTYELGFEFTAPGNAVVPVGFTAAVVSTYAAPEIDAASAAAGLTLLVGGLLVIRSRRITISRVA
jgi:hypothetical protein